jgi:FkbM family methyltransferase
LARADLTTAIRQGMILADDADASTSAPQADAPEADGPADAARATAPHLSLRGRLLGRVADYARRYLTASVEHRLTLALSELAVIREQAAATSAQAARDMASLQAGLHARLDVITSQVGDTGPGSVAQRAHFAWLQGAIEGLPGLLGPRLDELEIKSRPLIAFDEASYAVRLRDGYAMVPRDQPIFAVMVANATSGGLEPGTRRVLQALLGPGMCVADVGANVGLLTLACAVTVGPTGKVFAFEPEGGPRAQLFKTLHLNGLSWVEVFDCALGASEARAPFHVSPVIGHSSLYQLPETEQAAGRDIEVAVRRLDDVLGPSARLDVVKIDVEGAELDVLAGMSGLLAANGDLAIVAEFGPSHLARVGVTPSDWFEAFAAYDFAPFEIAEPGGECRPTGADDLAGTISTNIVFVRPGGRAISRLPR